MHRERRRAPEWRVCFRPVHGPVLSLRVGWIPGRTVGGSGVSSVDGVLLMASSTSDFGQEVLKTPS